MEESGFYDMDEYGAAMGEEVDNLMMEAYNPETGDVENMSLADFRGKFLVLFFYPADFTFVCPTELKELNDLYEEFRKEGAEVLVVSRDTVFVHKAWVEQEPLLKGFRIRMVADRNGMLSDYFGVERPDGNAERATFIIDPDGILRGVEIVDEPIGRSGRELLRKLKALKFVRENPGKACPAESSGDVYIEPSIKIAGHVGENIRKSDKE